jgi:hypothetical protein
MKPRIILADEPTGSLDRENALSIIDQFGYLQTSTPKNCCRQPSTRFGVPLQHVGELIFSTIQKKYKYMTMYKKVRDFEQQLCIYNRKHPSFYIRTMWHS